MEVGDNILDAIDEELSFEDVDDAEMMDVEEGEVVERLVSGKISIGNETEVDTKPLTENPLCTKSMNKNKKKKRNKKRKTKGSGGSYGLDVDRYVHGVCRHLREKKRYMVYTAVGIMGVSSFSDLVREVDAVQACGGQRTVDGDRFRSAGGVLWNILKVRDPNTYKEIMKKSKEFEKQFRPPSAMEASLAKISNSSQGAPDTISIKTSASTPDNNAEIKLISGQEQDEPAHVSARDANKRESVRDRMRMPVSYDDLLTEELPKDQSTST